MMRPNVILCVVAALLPLCASAQTKPAAKPVEYQFTTVKENPITKVKNQNRSGTCWDFSGLSFLESEAIRINKIKNEADYPDFAEMFVVSHSYQDRADKYIRMDGNLTFGAGSECEDVLHIMNDYGLVPQEVMKGNNYGTELPVHGELDATLKAYVQAINKNPNSTLSTAWKRGFAGILNAYLGECPTEFEYKGKKYTPKSYAESYNLKESDYVTLTSYTHHPFYTRFAIEVADNWRGDQAYNVPLDEMFEALTYAIEHGYTATWGGDVSEIGFTRDGLGILPDVKTVSTSGSDQEHWVGKAEENKVEETQAPKEMNVTQEYRQQCFDTKTTTDDHGMHTFGIAKDQFGNKYYMVKNSWGETGKYKGIWYISEPFCKAKMIDFMVHKDALPKALKEKLGIK